MCVCSALERQQALEETCSSLQNDNSSLREQVEEMTAELEKHREKENQMKSTQASLQARMNIAYTVHNVYYHWYTCNMFAQYMR